MLSLHVTMTRLAFLMEPRGSYGGAYLMWEGMAFPPANPRRGRGFDNIKAGLRVGVGDGRPTGGGVVFYSGGYLNLTAIIWARGIVISYI